MLFGRGDCGGLYRIHLGSAALGRNFAKLARFIGGLGGGLVGGLDQVSLLLFREVSAVDVC